MKKDKGKREKPESISSRIWRSIVRGPIFPRDNRERKWVVLNNLILHFRPVSLPKQALRYTHTFGLGGMSLVLVTLLAATGILLMFVYEPSPGRAYESIVSLENDLLFGKLIRNIHHWSANFLIAVALLHLLRVYFTGAYHASRQFNWIIGLVLLLGILFSNFTGYLLPWDQLSYWAITICTRMIGYIPFIGEWLQGIIRGGPEIGSATLINFYTFHTTVIPVLLIVFMAFHFWRVRKAHGVVLPRSPNEEADDRPEYVLTLPNLLVRESAVALVLTALIMVVSLVFDAPLGDPANPGMSPNPAKAPWYFVGFQEFQLHFHPILAVVFLPLIVLTSLFLIPYLKYDSPSSGVFLFSLKGRRMGKVAALTGLVVAPVWIVLDELWIDLMAWLPGLPSALSNGLLPGVVLAAVFIGYYRWLKKRYSANNNEAIQASFILIAVMFVVLTITGVWFRGAGMALVWPWNL